MDRIVEKIESRLPVQPKILRVAAYARVSSDKDAMLHSLSAQVSYFSDPIQNHPGWHYCGVFSDGGSDWDEGGQAGVPETSGGVSRWEH